jgi:hypothetical protein
VTAWTDKPVVFRFTPAEGYESAFPPHLVKVFASCHRDARVTIRVLGEIVSRGL